MLTNTTKSVEPVYSKIITQLRSRMASGKWRAGQQIATEKELAQEFNVCPATVTKSLKMLENEGLIWSRQGKGRFVADRRKAVRTGTIGLAVFELDHLTHPVMAQILRGIKESIHQTSYNFKIYAINSSHELSHRYMENLSETGLGGTLNVDGLILLNHRIHLNVVAELAEKVPIVWGDHETVNSRLAGVLYDWVGGVFEAARHLIGLGHRHISLISVDELCSAGKGARDGLRLAMHPFLSEKNGTMSHFTEVTNTVKLGYELAKQALTVNPRPTALICTSPEFAAGAYKAIKERNWAVPEDISLVGFFADIKDSLELPANITTVNMNFWQVGKCAADSLLQLIEGAAETVKTKIVDMSLVCGATTSFPNK